MKKLQLYHNQSKYTFIYNIPNDLIEKINDYIEMIKLKYNK